jgi:hypothetical protein
MLSLSLPKCFASIPNNAVAREQIEQIMMIYGTIPDREPEPDVLEGLREVGFDY